MRPSTPIAIAFDYAAFVADLKTRIASARLTAARAVSAELVGLYWTSVRRFARSRPRKAGATGASSDWPVT